MVKSLAKWEKVFYVVVLVVALFSRFIFLGDRAMSHDESIHTKFSWNLYSGIGFQHNPMMHGPLLFEMTALNYELFGVNDFTSRLFVALVGVALVLSPLLFRRWIGPAGAAAASLMVLVSPSITYYSRYIRHDILLLMSATMLLWALLRWVDDGVEKYLYYAAAAFSIVFTTKEASYMYTLIFLALCAIPLLLQFAKMRWQKPELIKYVVAITALLVVSGLVFALGFVSGTTSQTDLNDEGTASASTLLVPVWARVAGGLAFILLFVDLIMVVRAAGEQTVRANRWFDVVIAMGTLTLPLGSAFLIQFIAGVDMDVVYNAILNGNFTAVPPNVIVAFAVVIVLVFALSIALGLWWNRRLWWRMALIHYSLFFILYTTIFTWIFGALTGLVGSLAYWLGQQDDKRGGQPLYYYLMIGGLYEYLPILVGGASAILVVLGLKRNDHSSERDAGQSAVLSVQSYLPWFLLGWTVLSWIIYTWAGEKMPWLVVHIALPSIFLASLAFQNLYEWLATEKHSLALWSAADLVLILGAGVVLTLGSVGRFISLVGTNNPEAGYSLAQLNDAGAIVGGILIFLVASWLLVRYAQKYGFMALGKMVSVAILVVLIILTVRTNVMANYINDELATEFLVYAHGTPDIKVALQQIQDISWITDGSSNDIRVAYGEDGSWPLTWYMSAYPNSYFYGASPAPEVLLDSPVIIAGAKQYAAVDAIVGTEYRYFTYNFIWWPIQDYFGLNFERVFTALSNPDMRKALWDIVWARDYRAFALLRNPLSPFDLANWPLRGEFRLYVRNDLADQAWGYDYGTQSITSVKPQATVMPDPYSAGARFLPSESTVTLPGAALRGFALADDGTIYVGDTVNHTVWHVTMDGTVLGSIGAMGSQPGQFLEPWDVTLDDVGNIYVADTWNHRVQKFSPEGDFVTQWGINGMASDAIPGESPAYFFGPRGIAYHNGEIFVTDTGNKRVQVFDTSGTLLRAFGGAGMGAGKYDEPVGIAIDDSGMVAIVDTWHRRMQLVDVDGRPLSAWDVPVWDSANPDVKPYVSMNSALIAVTDPANRRVLLFNHDGEFQWALSTEAGTTLTFAQGVVLTDDAIYVTDTYAGTLTKFMLP